MSVLNRPMFNKQVVKRFEGSSQRGETANPEPILTRLFEMFKRLNPDYDPETDEFRQEEFKEEQEKSKNQVISKLYELIQKEDPESTLREGEFASEELTNKNPELYSLYNAFLADNIDSKEAEDF
jgi:lysyl-tRNA synthetase class I